MFVQKALTPEQVAEILQVSKNTVYELIQRGEIIAKKFGRVYRISPVSLSFVFTGLDEDLLEKQRIDEENLKKVRPLLKSARKKLWQKSKSF